MRITRHEKVVEIENLLHSIEREYESVNNCPDNDPRLKQLHEIIAEPTVAPDKELPLSEQRGYMERSQDLARKGYSVPEICKTIGLGRSSVKRFISTVSKPPRFNHMVKSTRNVNTYFSTLDDLADWRREHKITFNDLEDGEHGYKVIHKRLIRWCEVPLGSLYRDNSAMYVKTSEDFRESMKVSTI